ncbi:MAG: acetaldehyde dehydrogenase (acetylating) [Candidatus Sericytochromatia bacterium]|nr:acetaldehyde dehydrogenase (acetylating) [Candidatus Sericytochromatia bacterium]
MRIPCVLIGSGLIGTDLLVKLARSPILEPVWMVGIDPESEGLARARSMGLRTTDAGLEGFLPHAHEVRIAFDATSAHAHPAHAQALAERGILTVDLTPAAVGPHCVPPVNLDALLDRGLGNVNMVTCGGQATIPMVHAVSRVQNVAYAEIVATVASRSAGPGTRRNIDEFTRTTADALVSVGGAGTGKAIIILNPAEPPMMMRDTVHCILEGDPDVAAIRASVQAMQEAVRAYVPGYRIVNGPVFEECRVSIFLEVEGLGDHLPTYAGNLDIMTCAAVATGEAMVRSLTRSEVRA